MGKDEKIIDELISRRPGRDEALEPIPVVKKHLRKPLMQWLNYHHLFYFWTVARDGSIAKASDTLRLAPPTISEQIRRLEESLGAKLFEKQGRNLILTDAGRVAYEYAEDIFARGRELTEALSGGPAAGMARFTIGIADVVPKLIAYRLILPALKLPDRIRLICREGHPDQLISQLAIHEVDLVISDAPLNPALRIQAFSHVLGQSGLSFFAHPRLANKLKTRFPKCLDGLPFLMPADNTDLRRSLEHWLDVQGVRPIVVGEFEDSALAAVFSEAAVGAFAAPTPTEVQVKRQYGLSVLGRARDIVASYYAISLDRRLKHPAVIAISEFAHRSVFQR
jgi:LysR family transcriptional regulator, transcriptional activator of nhaA